MKVGHRQSGGELDRPKLSACSMAVVFVGMLSGGWWPPRAHADAIVHWGEPNEITGDYFYPHIPSKQLQPGQKANKNFRGHIGTGLLGVELDGNPGTTNDQAVYWQFSTSTSLNPISTRDNPGRLVYDITRQSGIFYGGLASHHLNYVARNVDQAFIETNGGGCSPWFVHPEDGRFDKRHKGPCDDVAVQIYNVNNPKPITKDDIIDDPADNLVRYHAAFIWKKEDFLGGEDNEVVTFDATSEYSLQTTRFVAMAETDAVFRLIAQDADQFYVSEASFVGIFDDFGHKFAVNPTATDWAEWYPQEGAYDFNFDQDNALFSPHVFRDIQSVGVYIENDVWASTSQGFSFVDFRVDAVSTRAEIPAPGTAVLMTGVLAGFGTMRRHRRRDRNLRIVP